MNRNNGAQTLIKGLAAHPYLWALGMCLFLHPFFFGAVQNIPNNALWLETFMVIGAAAAFGLHMYRSRKFDKSKLIAFSVSVVLADSLALKLYAQSESKAMWHFTGGVAVVVILVCMLRYYVGNEKYQTQINSLLIIGLGFCLKLYYVLITSVYTRQHDVGGFGGESGHAGYIEYLLLNHRLSDFDVRERWQFCHPPLHHAISSVWIYINENILLTGHDPARESLQMLTLFYSMCIIISAYRILRYFKLEGRALYIPLIIVSFHPTFILFSGSINNDVLSVAFMMGAVLSTLKWYENQTMTGIIKIALCVGLGMMTKVSAAVVAPPIALVFLIVLIKKMKTDGKKLMCQFGCFGLVCVPLGLWFGIRNYIKWGVPFTYVQEMSINCDQYLGNQSFISRVTDFSPHQFVSAYVQWSHYEQGYNEYNPLITLMKSALFGEWEIIGKNSAGTGAYVSAVPIILFWLNVAIAGVALVAMIVMCFKKSPVRPTEKLFLASFYIMMMVSFYKAAADYPFRCTMDFRYITPTVIVGAVFMGLFLKSRTSKDKIFDRTIPPILGTGACLFAVCSGVVYLALK